MSFIHEDPQFEQLLGIVARDSGLAEALIEKDYWVTHTLWAIHETGLDVWFKGGTSLSKGFGIIQRFSEDLDLMIRAGTVMGMPEVSNWTSTNKGPAAQRAAYYDALATTLVAPFVRVDRDRSRMDKRSLGADYLAYYPGVRLDQLGPAMSPFVRLEVGNARVEPCVEKILSSFVHDFLDAKGLLGDFDNNRPQTVRCVHPLVTLLEKLDALARRYERVPIEAGSFVRHYEDAAQIVRSAQKLPAMECSSAELAQEMLARGDIRTLPRPAEPALRFDEPAKCEALERAHAAIAPMFWGPRIPLQRASSEVREWLVQQGFQ